MKIKLLLIGLICSTLIAHAQPGFHDQAWLKINNIYYDSAQYKDYILVSFEDPSFEFRLFAIDQHINKQGSGNIVEELEFYGGNYVFYYYYNTCLHPIVNRRLYIMHKRDTMIIDFLNIQACKKRIIDSLVFQPGHVICNVDTEETLVQQGLTPYTIERLSKKGIIQYTSKWGNNLKIEPSTNVNFYSTKAERYLQYKKYDSALSNVNKALQLCKLKYRITFLNLHKLKYEICMAMGQKEEALKTLTESINSHPTQYTFYEKRIALYIEKNQLGMALEDYNKAAFLVKDVTDYSNKKTRIERARFKAIYLKDYEAAIQDLKQVLNSIPTDKHSYSLFNNLIAKAYFNLGSNYYELGKKNTVYLYWFKAFDTHHGYQEPTDIVPYFTVLIQKKPSSAQLYLARACARMQGYMYRKAIAAEKQEIDFLVLKDIEQAERLGYKDWRIHFYKAEALMRLENYTGALKEVDKAIEKNKTQAESWHLRITIKQKIGQYNWKTDSDQIQYDKLIKEQSKKDY